MAPLLIPLVLLLCSLARAQVSTVLIGGIDPYNMLSTVEVVTDVNKSCTNTVPAFPLARDGLAAASFSALAFPNDILACGGHNRGPWGASRACYHYWGAEDRWIDAPPMNYARSDANIHTFDAFNLVLGGGNSAVEILTGDGMGDWIEVESARLPDDSLTAACSVQVASPTSLSTSYIHLLGGRAETSFGTNMHYRLKVASDSEMSWEVMPEMPVAQQTHGCVVASIAQSYGIFVTGGRNDQNGPYSNQAFFFDLTSELWTELQELPEPRGWHSMGLIGQGVPAIFSGVPEEEDVPNGDIVTWNEADGSWTTWPNALSTARIQGVAGKTTQGLKLFTR